MMSMDGLGAGAQAPTSIVTTIVVAPQHDDERIPDPPCGVCSSMTPRMPLCHVRVLSACRHRRRRRGWMLHAIIRAQVPGYTWTWCWIDEIKI